MTTPVITFFNNKGGVGKTSLVYHTACMLAELGHRVLAVDLDPQANLTSMFLPEEQLEPVLNVSADADANATTVFQLLKPLLRTGDISPPKPLKISDNLHLIPGDLQLALYEDTLSEQWGKCLGSSDLYRPFRQTTAFWTLAQDAANLVAADVIVLDVGPNLGAMNRAALLATDFVVVPVAADMFSLQGLRNLGPTLARWRKEWQVRRSTGLASDLAPDLRLAFDLPRGGMLPVGYVVQQAEVRLKRPVQAYSKWAARIPAEYREAGLSRSALPPATGEPDFECLASFKHYRSLIAMAQEARKPVFMLKAADGALGGHGAAVQSAYQDFRVFSEKLLARIKSLPR